ncbi:MULTISPECIES: DUF4124 domain-containing protein [unclassified Motilimonas]|uniref:DUF4124 domain-containing protein n=1 Tax=Motilimonas TaxID=1914248 RepID=UPI001E5ED8DF|nr:MULTISPECIES: DUF4124 domain-containing protein [unclassified Motilimonas]MCE0559059.1 DUF4124 domain-containing protein [Motilimonas sp. E26]MDO6526983.1 DUF4124 domain-containing protein [Motilimonas sp. 1_MG-2023]
MKYLLLILSFYTLTLQANETDTVYRWVDKDGVTHYSDKKVNGAEKVRINISPSHKIPAPPTSITSAKPLPVAAKSNTKYQASITSPEHDSTIIDNTGNISVVTNVTPAFEDGQTLQLLIDGTPVGEKHQSTTLLATNIDRGSHSLQVQLIDKNGKIIASSEIITVHLRRASR